MLNQYFVTHNTNSRSLLFAQNKHSFNHEDQNLFKNRALISRNFLVKLIHKYWQETIFLSVSSSLSDKYINQLKSDGILLYKNEHKKFLLDFSKALFAGRIRVSLGNHIVDEKLRKKEIQLNNHSVSFIWRKGLNFPLPQKISLTSSFREAISSNKKKIHFYADAKNDLFPVFTVVNELNQMVLTESKEEVRYNFNALDKIYFWYCNNFCGSNHVSPSYYYGLFFTHSSDALEHLNTVKSKYCKSKQDNLRLLAIKLQTYYRLNQISERRLKIKLIPDLKELSSLIYKYRYCKNIQFHHSQKYGRNFFKGQPVYLVKSVYGLNKKTRKTELVNLNCTDMLISNNQKNQRQFVFTNYKTATKIWHEFRQKSKNYSLPNKPHVLVSNLEDLMKFYGDDKFAEFKNFRLIPSQQSYEFIKQNQDIKEEQQPKQVFFRYLHRLQTLIERIAWSLTSRQPIS